jgi:apolipoprotein N-acyltransferase
MSSRRTPRVANRLLPVLAALSLGAVAALAFAPISWPIASIGSLAGLWMLWSRRSPAGAAACGFAYGFGLFAVGTYWLYTAVHGVGKVPIPVALLLMGGLVSIMAAYYAAVGWCYARFARRHLPIDCVCVLPSMWILMEWLRGWFLSGFPWLAFGYSQIDTPLAGYAPVLGVYGASFAAALVAGGLVMAAHRRFAIAMAIFVCAYGAGYLLRGVQFVVPSGPPVSVALVQGSVPQDEKWASESREPTKKLYAALTEQAWGSRIILWPEATLPQLYHDAVPFLSEVYAGARAHGSALVLGLLRYDADADSIRNGLVALDEDEEWYYKRRLVPFGEYFPVPEFVRSWMRLQNLAYVDLAPGAERQPPLHVAGLKLGETICYEDSYAAEQLEVLKEADVLVNVSNDAWYGDSSAPHQHLEITRMRSLEAGRWMMRATNNGISALIAPDGRVVARTRQFVPEVLKGTVTPYSGLTPYARLGNRPVLILCVFGLLLGLYVPRRAQVLRR